MKVWKLLGKLINFLLILVLCFIGFIVISSKISGSEPVIFGYQLKTVLSGSMEPGIKTGSVIAIQTISSSEKENIETGEVITFQTDEGELITHRVVDVTISGEQVIYTTKGDNNDTPDSNPVLSQNVVGQYNGFQIPYLGYFLNFAHSRIGTLILTVVPGLLLLLYAFTTIMKAFKELEGKNPTLHP